MITKVLLLLFLSFSSLQAIELNWEHDYEAALKQAKKEKKLVYLFIGADKCVYCERFKKMTLSNKKLIEDMKKEYILLYMSRDRHNIPERFKMFGVPYHYFLTPEGKIIAEIQGSRELDGWYDVLDEIELRREK
jgi:uncharacterized protein YyaL (SSP411 family)